jgi:hypothetical protein
MKETNLSIQQSIGYILLLVGFSILMINHISVLMGNPWLIPEFMRL